MKVEGETVCPAFKPRTRRDGEPDAPDLDRRPCLNRQTCDNSVLDPTQRANPWADLRTIQQ